MEYGILRGTTFDIRHLFILVTCLINLSLAQYKWNPGEWSTCICAYNGQGQQSRHVSCMYEDRNGILNYADERNCENMPHPSLQRSCYEECIDNRYPIIDQYQVTWAVETWGQCQLIPRVKKCARGMGIRYRNVTCVFKSNGKLQNDSVCLSFEPKPSQSESCDLQCKQNCIVTPWGAWSNCDNCEKTSRTRTRTVVIPADHGGKECPPFSEIDKCANCSSVYYISVERWSPCVSLNTIPDNFPSHSLIGHQERAVKCLDSIGATVLYIKCKEHVKMSGKFIADHQPCIIPQDCQVSMWSPWQPINSSCLLETGSTRPGLMRREREVKKLPRGLGKSCPPLIETTPVLGSLDKLRYCPRTKWITSSWSKCMAVNGGLQCTTGMQHRKAICVEENENGDQKPVEDSLCTSPRPMISQLCPADCDWDCTVSLWSQWSDCTVTECDQYARKRRNNQKTGQRYRTREILTPPGKNGQQCPHLSETQNCDPEPCYFWNTSSGPCSLETRYGKSVGETCGVGLKQQTTTCVDKKGMRVRDELCSEWEARPESQMLCVIPCRKDCVTSEWGEWSECPDICETEQDVAYRPSMRSRQKTILARAGQGGTECPGERELIQNKPCPTVIECAVFIWSADPWGDCELEGRQCGQGKQTRGVHCYNRNNQFVQDEKCTQSVKPETTKSCIIPCPRDCHLTSWSAWASCSASCFVNKDNIPTKSRQRFILQEPDNGGAPCPEVLQEVEQCTELPLCNQLQWKISNWSSCVLAPTLYKCGKGLRARDISCMAINGTEHLIEACLKFLGPMPPVSEACYKSCDKECLFTDWTEWSHCIQGCSGHQFRSRELTGGTGVPTSCRNTEVYPTYMKRGCQLCETLKPMSTGEWSDCILEPVRHDYITNQPELTSSRGKRTRNTTSLDMGNVCGTGKRIKVVACSKHGSGLEPAEKCKGAGYEEEVCLIPCPVDCEMSDWTVWTECPAKCGAGEQTRYRNIRRLPSAGGRQCPSLGSKSKEMQKKLCHPECIRYVWKCKAWGTCMLHGPQNCGNGTQTRHVRCEAVNRHGFTTGTASEDLCTGQQRPSHLNPCYLYCLKDCVVSEWTSWTKCSKPCNHNDRQVRTREVLRYWIYDTCPVIRETKPCIKNDNCIEYYWEWSSWTTCLINNGMDDCGVGHKERYTICKNHFGQTVDNELCEKDADPVTEPAVVSCEVVCDVDCLVSEWTRWSSCSKPCGLGVSERERTVVEQYSRNGRPCPDMLVQQKPCFLQGCYNWAVSDWSNCTSQNGICGHGIQKRNISCVSEDGISLDPSKCPPDLDVLIMETERKCTVPCPGECVMTDWTSWNTCYLSREDFIVDKYRSLGVQSRSRAILAYPKLANTPCPEKLWEKRHCVADKGMFFAWQMSPWNNDNKRSIWCERSDGLLVMGGCDIGERPPERLRCDPECPLLATCNDTNTCICTSNLIADYTRSGVLRACLTVNSTVEPKAQENEPSTDGTSIWMYAVLAAGTVFIIFVALAFYNMSEHFRSGPRPRGKEDEEAAEKLNTGTLDSHHQNGLEQPENCPNVNTHLCAPTSTNTNHLYENSKTNALWVRASSKSVRSRITRKFYSMLYFCGCSKHVHETDYKDTYTAYVDNTDNESYRRMPEVDYSDKPTISNQSSVDIELVEMPKKSKNGSDSAISMQNSSNDSGRTLESYSNNMPLNYSRPEKRLKKPVNSIDKQRSFDSYTIAEGDGNETEDVIGIVQLEHVPAFSQKSSPRSTISLDSKTNSLHFGRGLENCDSEDDSNLPPYLNGGSGLFSVQPDMDGTPLLDEMKMFSKLLFSNGQNSDDSNSNGMDDDAICLERKPSLGTKPKLQRQKQIVQADIEQEPVDMHYDHLDHVDEVDEKDNSYTDIRSLDENKNEQQSQDKDPMVKRSKSEVQRNDSYIKSVDSEDSEVDSSLTSDGRTDSYDTFKDLVTRKCHTGRKKDKMSRTTTV